MDKNLFTVMNISFRKIKWITNKKNMLIVSLRNKLLIEANILSTLS